jgi:hypothetical protein
MLSCGVVDSEEGVGANDDGYIEFCATDKEAQINYSAGAPLHGKYGKRRRSEEEDTLPCPKPAHPLAIKQHIFASYVNVENPIILAKQMCTGIPASKWPSSGSIYDFALSRGYEGGLATFNRITRAADFTNTNNPRSAINLISTKWESGAAEGTVGASRHNPMYTNLKSDLNAGFKNTVSVAGTETGPSWKTLMPVGGPVLNDFCKMVDWVLVQDCPSDCGYETGLQCPCATKPWCCVTNP